MFPVSRSQIQWLCSPKFGMGVELPGSTVGLLQTPQGGLQNTKALTDYGISGQTWAGGFWEENKYWLHLSISNSECPSRFIILSGIHTWSHVSVAPSAWLTYGDFSTMRLKRTPNCVIIEEDAISVPLLLKSKMISIFPDDISSCELIFMKKFMFLNDVVEKQPWDKCVLTLDMLPKRDGEVDLRACTYKCGEKEWQKTASPSVKAGLNTCTHSITMLGNNLESTESCTYGLS